MRKRRCTGIELGLYIAEREGERVATGVEIANDGHDAGGFDSNSRGALKGVTEGESKGGAATGTTPRIEEQTKGVGGAREAGKQPGGGARRGAKEVGWRKGIDLASGPGRSVREERVGERWAGAGLVGREEGWAGGLRCSSG
jgi:hypothetical protein